jgi:F-type H+-transporting ATPase subunit epsilon
MDGRRSFHYEILTPQGRIADGTAVGAVLPAADGLIGILAHRAPLVAELKAGCVTVRLPEGRSEEYFVAGGFAHVHRRGLTVLAEQGDLLKSLNAQTAAAELKDAHQMPAGTADERQRRKEVIATAEMKLRLATKQASSHRSV